MKQFKQRYAALFAIIILMFTSCQIGSLNSADTEVSSIGKEEFGEMSIILPAGRGWTAAKYKVTASRTGEKTETKETSVVNKNITMRLKAGKWSFVAEGYDSKNVVIFRSDAVEGTVAADKSSSISLLLKQQSAAAKYSFQTTSALNDVINKIIVNAETTAGDEFGITKDVTSLDQTVDLTGLLTGYEYTIKADAYCDNVKYATATQTKTFDNVGTIESSKITLNQIKVTEISSNKVDGAGFSNADETIALTCGTTGAVIHYTTDGSIPSESSTQYNNPIALFSGMTQAERKTIKAIAYADGMTESNVFSAEYSFDPSKAASPTFTPQDGKYTTDQTVDITSSDGGTIMYKIDNGDWATYSGSIQLIGNQTDDVTIDISAYVTGVNGKSDSDVITQTYVVSYPQLAMPSFNPSNENYDTDTTFTLSASVDGAVIYYTTDGTVPTTSSTKYTTPLKFNVGTHTVKAIAVANGYKNSNVQTWTWTITEASVPVTDITLTPTSAELVVGGDTATFTVTFTPEDANTDKTLEWSISPNNVAAVIETAGATATVKGLAEGSATLTAHLKNDPMIYAEASLAVTTTTLPPVQGDLGYMHPTSGNYSPADSSEWATASYALGANVDGSVTTFSLYSANATKVLLEIYDQAYGADAKYDYWMTKNTTTNRWQAKLSGNLNHAMYAFRVWGPNWTFSDSWAKGGSSAGCVGDTDYDANGNRFNPNKVVFDPYAREITHDPSNAEALADSATGYNVLSTGDTYRNLDSGKYAPKGYVIADSTSYGTKPQIPQKDAIIYEAHVRGITKHSSAANLHSLLNGYEGFENVVDIPDAYRGTYKGAAMLVPYLKALGINTIELLPVHETDNDANPDNNKGGNFWGYMTFDYFAPDRRYSSDKSAGGPTREFKEMVETFHNAGMEVYLDVVYNHSGEGGTWHGNQYKDNEKTIINPEYDEGKQCTIVSMRGIDNATYYSLVPDTKWSYWENTGCGNNLQCDNAYVRQFILDSLTYWIDTMGVDGFRFDLAPVLGREGTGSWAFNGSATTISEIASLGTTKNVEMIAEAWDCSGSFVGGFPSGWGEWNGNYRDAVRAFIGNATDKDGITYTREIYGDKDGGFGTTTHPSVNFICAHDGFTLADLCSYSGSGNWYNSIRDWPFGPSDGGNSDQNYISTNIYINDVINEPASRRQRARNYMAFQMFSAGIPMIVYGDELCRTQNGNNNPYNLDSVATWNNYAMAATSSPQTASTGSDGNAECGTYENMFGTYNNDGKNGQLVFSSFVMNERLNNESLRQIVGDTAMKWYYLRGEEIPNGSWEDGNYKAIMINGSGTIDGGTYYMMINMTGESKDFTVPECSVNGKEWVRIVDTGSWAENEYNCWSSDNIEAYSFKAATVYGVGAYTIVIFKQRTEVQTCVTPIISSSNGLNSFDGGSITITIMSSNGSTVYYTTDGSDPKIYGVVFNGPFEITKTTTVKAYATKPGWKTSDVVSDTFTNTMVCNDPILSVPTGDFWNEITVFLTGDDAYYYTTNGNDPTTSSTAYTSAGIDISATTTLKVLAHDTSGSKGDATVTAVYTKQNNPSITEDPSGVMLQGFNWASAYVDDPNWYTVVKDNAASIKNTFEYIWLPPPSKTPSFARQGYIPTELNDLNNYYGTATQLAEMIAALDGANGGTKAIADIVINHRGGKTGYGDFENPRWMPDFASICSGDDGFNKNEANNRMYNWTGLRGNADTGNDYNSAQDLDHTQAAVQKGIYSWMNSVLKRVGFVGWRYDFVKGFNGKYVGYYNTKTSAGFSVGEYWPDNSDNWVSSISNWITATGASMQDASGATVTGTPSKAFDFVLKSKLNAVFGCGNNNELIDASNIDNVHYDYLADTSTLMRSNPSMAVTFIDNHDTGSTQKEWFVDPCDIAPAYAFILTHPGKPCVAWQHYFTATESKASERSAVENNAQYIGGNIVPKAGMTYRQLIDRLIAIRKSAGITTTSVITNISITSEHYIVKVTGTNGGELIVKIGGGSYTATGTGYDGNLPVVAGDNFAVWEKGKTITDYNEAVEMVDLYFYNSSSWPSVNVHVWTEDGADYTSWPGAIMTADGDGWYKYSIPQTATNVIFTNNGSDTGKIEKSFNYETPVYKDGMWYESKEASEAKNTVYFYNANSWSSVYLYCWEVVNGENSQYSAWPGTLMTADANAGSNWYKAEIPAGYNDVIFNNNNGQQTPDMSFTDGVSCYKLGNWYETPASAAAKIAGKITIKIKGSEAGTVYIPHSGGWSPSDYPITFSAAGEEKTMIVNPFELQDDGSECFELKVIKVSNWPENNGDYSWLWWWTWTEGGFQINSSNISLKSSDDKQLQVHCSTTDEVLLIIDGLNQKLYAEVLTN